MYQLVKKINNVNACSSFKNKITFVDNNGFYVDEQKFDVLPILYKTDVTNENIWIKDNNWENYLLNTTTSELKKLEFSIGLNGIITDIITIFENNVLSCYSTLNKKNILNFPIIENIKYYLSSKNNVYFQVENHIKSLSLLTGEYEWDLDLGEFGNIRKVIGVVFDKLWVSITTGNGITTENTIVCIDIKYGNILEILNFDWQFNNFGVLLYEPKNVLISLNEKYFVAIDVVSNKIINQHEVESLKINKLNIRSFTVYKHKIYFTANDSAQIVANTVGVLDYDTLELLWSSKVSPGNLLLDPPQVTDDKLYVLGAEGTLHIFEKETNA